MTDCRLRVTCPILMNRFNSQLQSHISSGGRSNDKKLDLRLLSNFTYFSCMCLQSTHTIARLRNSSSKFAAVRSFARIFATVGWFAGARQFETVRSLVDWVNLITIRENRKLNQINQKMNRTKFVLLLWLNYPTMFGFSAVKFECLAVE